MTICAGDDCRVLKAHADEPERDPESRAAMLAELDRRAKAREGLVIAPPNIDAKGWGTTCYELPDGSACCVDTQPYGSHLGSMISHLVDGECVWGQVVSKLREEHAAQVMRVVAKMHVVPDAFVRPSWRELGYVRFS
jgi:hypothetical protein